MAVMSIHGRIFVKSTTKREFVTMRTVWNVIAAVMRMRQRGFGDHALTVHIDQEKRMITENMERAIEDVGTMMTEYFCLASVRSIDAVLPITYEAELYY
jgi:hypothetical protein